MRLNNLDVRLFVEQQGVTYKQIAKEIGISQEWMSRLMRKDLSPGDKLRILKAVQRLKEKEEEPIYEDD